MRTRVLFHLVGLVALSLGAIACAGTPGEDEGGSTDDDPSVGETEDALGRAGGLRLDRFADKGCADPGVTRDGDRYFMTCTGGSASAGYFRTYESRDLVNWSYLGKAIPAGGLPWALDGKEGVRESGPDTDAWAPEIHHVAGGYALIFSVKYKKTGQNTVSIAFSQNAAGPYTEAMPLVPKKNRCTIDGHIYKDGDHLFLYWKDDETNRIRAARLKPDGRGLASEGEEVLRPTAGWERGGAEAPFLTQIGNAHYMFYSGGSYTNATYAVGVARAGSPLGNFTKSKRSAPITHSNGRYYGAGHNSVVRGPDGKLYMILHAYDRTKNDNVRYPIMERIIMDNGWPVLRAP